MSYIKKPSAALLVNLGAGIMLSAEEPAVKQASRTVQRAGVKNLRPALDQKSNCPTRPADFQFELPAHKAGRAK